MNCTEARSTLAARKADKFQFDDLLDALAEASPGLIEAIVTEFHGDRDALLLGILFKQACDDFANKLVDPIDVSEELAACAEDGRMEARAA